MEVFRLGEALCQQFRADDLALRVGDQAAVGLMLERGLGESPDDQRDKRR